MISKYKLNCNVSLDGGSVCEYSFLSWALSLRYYFYFEFCKQQMNIRQRYLLAYFTLLFLLTLSQCVKTDHQESTDEFFVVLNSMMNRNGLPQTRQIKHCFTPEELANTKNAMSKLTSIAAQAGTTELKNYPEYYQTYTQNMFSKNTLSCLYKSRDFSLLMLNYGVDLDKMGNVFVKSIDQNYLAIHKAFVDMKALLLAQLYQEYAKYLDIFFKDVFGQRIKTENEWVKAVSNLQNFDPKEYFGIAVSNGVIGAVSSIQPINVATTVLAGAYDVFGRGRVDNIVETFPALQLQANVGGYDITGGDDYYNYEQGINFRHGQFSGAFSSEKCSIKYTYWALKNLPFAFYTSLEVVAHDNTQIQMKLKHEAPDYLNDIQKRYENLENQKYFSMMHTKATSKTGKLDLVIASSYLMSDDGDYKFIHDDSDSNRHVLRTRVNLTKGNTYKFGFISALISSAHHQDPVNQALRIVQRAILIGQEPLIAAHRNLWENLWKNDIIIQGQDEDQKNIRLMLYHCYAFINDYKSYGISPMGLSGLGYNGHVFWDMDLWIYPGILGLNPHLAKTLIEYRYQRLDAAKNNAFINGYKGAVFPWESSSLGIEQTPIWALSGPLEHHITGCVAIAAWNYFAVTQDTDWLEKRGWEIISAASQFWQSRVQLGQDGLYHIKNVVAADEWAQNVDDNAFTNAVAKQTLRLYNVAAQRLSIPHNKDYQQISEKIVILKMANNVTREHSRYNGENIKQADVNLLSFPLKTITDVDQIKRDLAYYQTRIPDQGTPAMTYSIFTILYSRLMDSDKAYEYFIESHRPNLRKPFSVFTQTKGGHNPYFLTGAGGVIQSLVFGFGGYDITQDGLKKIPTAIPKQWKSVTIKGMGISQRN